MEPPSPRSTFSTSTSLSCGQWRTFHTARVDLVDRHSNLILSTTGFKIGCQLYVTATVLHNVTAPQMSGPWPLLLNLYIFEEASMAMASTHHPVNIMVGRASSSPQQASSNVATSTLGTVTTSIEVVISAQTSSEPTTTQSSSVDTMYAFAGAIVAAAVIVALSLFRARKRNA